jgi:phospholipid-translocating ATPase
MILLRTKDPNGSVFIKTDQLDGETDWKLRKAVGCFQRAGSEDSIWDIEGVFNIEGPKKEIYDFAGNFTPFSAAVLPSINEEVHQDVESLGLENTLWANTVVASGSILGLVIYTGKETRSVMNANLPPSKIGATDMELNDLSKVLFALTIALAAVLVLLKGLQGPWYMYFFRFILLFSAIIPISLRVNLDLAKTLYSYMMMRDPKIAGTIARSSTIPEELGRISYLFSDKVCTVNNFFCLLISNSDWNTDTKCDGVQEAANEASSSV